MKTVSSASGAGKLDSDMQNEPGPLSYTIHRNKLKMDEGPECETGNHQNTRGESRKKTSLTSATATLVDISLQARQTKANMNY